MFIRQADKSFDMCQSSLYIVLLKIIIPFCWQCKKLCGFGKKWLLFGKNYRKPGETFEVDWAGATVDIHDSVTGEITPAYLFVGVLSCSSLVYAELCRDMKSENFILCHVHAYEYFGGVPRLVVPDNI